LGPNTRKPRLSVACALQPPATCIQLIDHRQKSFAPLAASPVQFVNREGSIHLSVGGAPIPIPQTIPPSDRRLPSLLRHQLNFNPLEARALPMELYILVNKPSKTLHGVQNGLGL